jgi:hypothetical protein
MSDSANETEWPKCEYANDHQQANDAVCSMPRFVDAALPGIQSMKAHACRRTADAGLSQADGQSIHHTDIHCPSRHRQCAAVRGKAQGCAEAADGSTGTRPLQDPGDTGR